MSYILAFAEMMAAVFSRKSKLISIIIAVTLIIMIGWSSGTADFSNNEGRYIYYDTEWINSITEPLYTLIMKTCNSFGMPFRTFLVLEAVFIVSVFLWFIQKESDSTNYVLMLYFIWPFCRDAVVLRTTLATTFLYIAFHFYLKSGKRNLVWFSLVVFTAGMIHYGMLFYLVLFIPALIPSKEDIVHNRATRLFVYIFVAELFFFKVFPQLPFTGVLVNKINFVLKRSVETSGIITAPGALRTLFMFILYYFLHRQVRQKLKRDAAGNKEKLEKIHKIFYINLYQMLCIPLYNYVPDLWRLHQALMILNYVEFSFYLNSYSRHKYKRSELIFIAESVGYGFIYLFIIVLKTDQFWTVLRPLFENNVLFQNIVPELY